MSIQARIDRHSNLVNRMAEATGADLVEAAMRGIAPDSVVRSAVLNCMSCRQADACEDWLEEHGEAADATPEYCRNKAMLERLARS